MVGNGCFGCGPNNHQGLAIKSYWQGGETHCQFQPEPHMSAGPPHFLNGGIIATVIDCHTVCTAAADAYRQEGREIGDGETIWYVTGKLSISYKAPAPISGPVDIKARISERKGRKSVVECELFAGDTLCATAEVIAIRVDPEWFTAPQ